MSNFRLFGNIKLTVFAGYVILFALAIFGLVRINKELVNFSEVNNPLTERKELNIVSNALVSLYEAESMRKMMLTENFYTPSLFSSYNVLDQRVRIYVDSLYQITPDEHLRQSLDTVNVLLDEKKQNFLGMMALMDSIKNLPYSKILTTSILSRKDMSDLSNLINHKMIQRQDTTYYIKERKSFINRLRAVFSNKEDSTRVVTTEGQATSDTIHYTPAEILTDTLVQYINQVNDKSDRRKIAYMTKLAHRQNTMLYYDEMLTAQINSILKRIEDEEKQMLINIGNKKSEVLKRSSRIVSSIGIASILVIILFLPLTILLINRNQKFRNELEQSNKFAQNLLKSRERLLLMISHDVKAPLSSIIGHIELMFKDKMPQEEKEHLNSMRTSSEQLLDLSNKLMDFHRLEQGKSEVSIVPFLPHRLMEDIYKSFIPLASKKNLTLKSESDIDPKQTYESDPFIIKQILNNLINNAIKFTSAGEILVKSSIDTATNNLNIIVKDTGIGIKEEDAAKIFEEFERAGSAEEKHAIDGYGLGLPITNKLVKLLGGEIRLTSVPGKGSEFKVSIPLILSEENIQDENTDENTSIEKLSAKVLMIDDDEAILNVYSKLLEKKGVDVTLCYNSSQVIDLLKNNDSFDIIFTDIQMPQINGFELVKKIRDLGGVYLEIPIVALSARSDVSEKDFKSAGFNTFISKPVSFELMYKIIHQFAKELPEQENSNDLTDISTGGFDALIEYVKDDKEVSLDILNTFLDDSINKTESVKKAIEAQDWDSIKSNAHKMLPLMTMIGEKEITNILIALESGEQNQEKVQNLILLVEKVNKEAARFIKEFSET